MKNKTGNIHIIGIIIIMAISSLFFIIAKQNINTLMLIKKRQQTYLCFKSFITETRKYVKTIGNLNRAIKLNYPLQYIPQTALEAKALSNILKLTQSIAHFSYMKKILANKYCASTFCASLLFSMPYQTYMGTRLKRDSLGLTKIRKKKWTIIFAPTTKANLKKSFLINAKLTLLSPLSTKLKLKSKEISIAATQLSVF